MAASIKPFSLRLKRLGGGGAVQFTQFIARPGGPRHLGCALGHFNHLIHLAIAMQRDVAARVQSSAGTIREAAAQRLHGQIVGHQNTLKADLFTDHLSDHGRR